MAMGLHDVIPIPRDTKAGVSGIAQSIKTVFSAKFVSSRSESLILAGG